MCPAQQILFYAIGLYSRLFYAGSTVSMGSCEQDDVFAAPTALLWHRILEEHGSCAPKRDDTERYNACPLWWKLQESRVQQCLGASVSRRRQAVSVAFSPRPQTVRQETIRKDIMHALFGGNCKNPEWARVPAGDAKLCPWHLHLEHRRFDKKTGYFEVLFSENTIYKDAVGKIWKDFPPPNYAPKKCVDDEIPSRKLLPEDRWIKGVCPQKCMPPCT